MTQHISPAAFIPGKYCRVAEKRSIISNRSSTLALSALVLLPCGRPIREYPKVPFWMLRRKGTSGVTSPVPQTTHVQWLNLRAVDPPPTTTCLLSAITARFLGGDTGGERS